MSEPHSARFDMHEDSRDDDSAVPAATYNVLPSSYTACPLNFVQKQYSPIVTHLVWPHQLENPPEKIGFGGLVHEEAHPSFSYA